MTCMFVPAISFPQVAPEHVEDNDAKNAGAGASGAEAPSVDVQGKNSDGQPTTSEPILEQEH